MKNLIWIDELLEWFESHKRKLPWRDNSSAYSVHVSEVMLQQTRSETVIPYFHRFMNLFPDYQSLAIADEEILMKSWEGLGYYSRVRNLQKAAREIIDRYDGEFPHSYGDAIAISGIGAYTAGAILSRAYHLPYASVDGNVLRVYTRLMADASDISKETTKKKIKEQMEIWMKGKDPSPFNETWMEIGATICLPSGTPKCEECPLKNICLAHRKKEELFYPKKTKKTEQKVLEVTCVFYKIKERYLFFKKKDGVLKNLPSPYLFDRFMSEDMLEEDAFNRNIRISRIIPLQDKKHIFTHQIWLMKGYVIECENFDIEPSYAVDKSEIFNHLTLPTCFKKFIVDSNF